MDITRAKAAGQKQGVWGKNGVVRCASRRQQGMGKKRSRPWQGCKLAKLFGGQLAAFLSRMNAHFFWINSSPFRNSLHGSHSCVLTDTCAGVVIV